MTATVLTIPTAEQERLVLRALQSAGSRGAHSHELARHLPILNVPERIRRLRKAGWEITSTRERSPFGGKSWGARYRLLGRLSILGGAVVTTEPVAAGRQLTLQPGTAPEADHHHRRAA